MKRLAVVLMCVCFLFSFTFSAFAATSCEDWISDKRANYAEKIIEAESSIDATELFSYPMYHIMDDTFFEKTSSVSKMFKFISKECDILTIVLQEEGDIVCSISYADKSKGKTTLVKSIVAEIMIVPADFSDFVDTVDRYIEEDEFGMVREVSLLYGDFLNFKINGTEDTTTLNVVFAYIRSSKGEFLVPYTLIQTAGDQMLENGKIYTVKECSNILKEKISVGKFSNSEQVNILYPWQIAIIAVAGAAALAGAFFGMKKIIKRKAEREN